MYGNDVRRTAIFGQYGTAVRSVRNCSENTNVYGVRPFTTLATLKSFFCSPEASGDIRQHPVKSKNEVGNSCEGKLCLHLIIF